LQSVLKHCVQRLDSFDAMRSHIQDYVYRRAGPLSHIPGAPSLPAQRGAQRVAAGSHILPTANRSTSLPCLFLSREHRRLIPPTL
jgi:hypothetical protein